MMYGHEKSDPTIVATKPANKADQPAAERSAAEPTAAEPVERRAGTKGNAGQQSTHRTQSRAICGWCSGASGSSFDRSLHHVIVNADRRGERSAAVHDAMADRLEPVPALLRKPGEELAQKVLMAELGAAFVESAVDEPSTTLMPDIR
jgi:hypothetical protein